MEPHRGFVGRRVIKVKGDNKGQRGLIVEVKLPPGIWQVLFDTTKLTKIVNPYEFESELNKRATT